MFKKFSKEDRTKYPFWFAHWCAFQMVSIMCKVWKPSHLLHDIDKPFLLWRWKRDYTRVADWHLSHNRHHLRYALTHDINNIDWLSFVIDAVCAHYTQDWIDAKKSPVDIALAIIEKETNLKVYKDIIISNVKYQCDKLGIEYNHKSK